METYPTLAYVQTLEEQSVATIVVQTRSAVVQQTQVAQTLAPTLENGNVEENAFNSTVGLASCASMCLICVVMLILILFFVVRLFNRRLQIREARATWEQQKYARPPRNR